MRWSFSSCGMLAMLGLLVVAQPALSQTPVGIHVSLGSTLGDADMAPPDVSHLVVQWAVLQPYLPAHRPEVRWSIDGGDETATPAIQTGLAKDTSRDELELQPQYAARLSPLLRGANVTYRVGEPALGYTEPVSVHMVPFQDQDVRLAVFSQIGYAGYDRITRARLPNVDAPADVVVNRTLASQPDLVLIPGNIAMSTSLRPWDITLTTLQPLASTVPVMTVPGTSDAAEDFHHLRERFVFPLTEPGTVSRPATFTSADDVGDVDDKELLYHGFSVGPVYVVGLSAPQMCERMAPSVNVGIPPCTASEGQLNLAQIAWLHDILEDAREDLKPSWLIVYLSDGPYVFADDGGNRRVDDYWRPLWETYNVDLVLYGQEAIYQRSYPLWDGHPATTALSDYKVGTGPIYVNTGGGGWTQTEAIQGTWPPWLAASVTRDHVTFLDATQDSLTVTAIAAEDGATLDTFTLHKSSSPGYMAASGRQGPDDALAEDQQEAPALALTPILALGIAFILRRRVA